MNRREHLQALLLAFACAVLFLRDGLLPGRALVPHPPQLFDVQMAEAKAAGTFDPHDVYRGNVGMTDKYLQSLCWDRVMQDRFAAGELPRWTRDIGGGAPFVPQMAQPYQPINALLLLIPSEQWYGVWYLVHLCLFGWFAYLFLRRLGCRHGAALLGLVAAVLGMWTQCKLHHNVILTAALSLWPMLSATHELVARGADARARRFAIGWLSLWTGLSWLTGFVVIALQASYLTVAFALLLACFAPRGDRLRRLLPVGIGLGLGGLLSLANMLPILMASAESARAGQFELERLIALGLERNHALSLIWPDLLSWPADTFYPDDQAPLGYRTRMPLSQIVLLDTPLRPGDSAPFQNWVETSFAVGTVPLAAALTALTTRLHRRFAWFFGAAALVAFGVACAAEPLFSLARIVPGIMAGDVRRLVFVTAVGLVVLTGLGADVWLRGHRRWLGATVCGLIAIAAALLIAWLAKHGDEPSFVRAMAELFVADRDHPVVQQVGGNAELVAAETTRKAMPGEIGTNWHHLQRTGVISLLVALAGGVLVLLLGRRFVLPALLAVTAVELLVVGAGPVQTVPAADVTRVPKVFRAVLAEHVANQPRPRLQRLVATDAPQGQSGLPGNLPGFLGLADANAYNPLPPARFEQFFGCIEQAAVYGGAGVGSFRAPASLRHPLCDLYGIRFIVTRQDVATDGDLVDRTPAGTGGYRLLERTTAMPRATFVRTVDVIPDATARLTALRSPDRDVRNRVVLERDDAPRPAAAGSVDARVTITEHRDERVALTVTCSHDGYVRLADPFDAGWRATVDGEPTDVFVADHYLRAVHVPAGEHEIVFTYDGARVVWPLRLTLLALLAIVFCLSTGRRSAT